MNVDHPVFSYLQRGWWVLPLHSMRAGQCSCGHPNDQPINGRRHTPGKHPRTPNGVTDASNDPAVVRAWLERWPDMNVGIATGPSGLYVLDVDVDKGGKASMEALVAQCGPGIMDTVRAKTGSGGYHIYYSRPADLDERNTASLLGPGLDSRGVGGYVVAPPGNHLSGGTYEWAPNASPDNIALLPLPEVLLRALEQARQEKSTGKRRNGAVPHELGDRIPKGRRDSTLLSLAGSLRSRAVPQAAIEATLLDVNRRLCDPPLPEDAVLDNARRYSADLQATRLKTILDAGEHDQANADRLIALFGENIRFVHEWGWIVWEGTHWTRDTFGRLPHYAHQVARTIQEHALRLGDGEEDRRKRLLTWAHKTLSVQKAAAMIKAAEGRPELRAAVGDFDRHDLMLNVKNGVIDLQTGRLEPHGRELRITSLVDIEYDADAKCPQWDAFVKWCCTPSGADKPDEELMAFLQRCAGYTLTGSVVEHCLFFLYGDGRNGKSVFINLVRALVGDLATTLPFGTLLESRDAKTETAMADLAGKRMATAIEGGGETRSFNEEFLKSLTGGDKGLRGRYLYGNAFFFDAKYKIWLANNNKPVIRGSDEGIWERIMMVPFRNHLPRAKRDKQLEEKLRTELPGILAWAVRGAVEWGKGGLRPPAAVTEATEDYRRESDAFGRFLEECCTVRPDLQVRADDLLRAYNTWADEQHEKQLTANAIGRRIAKARGGLFKPDKSSVRIWIGLGLGRAPPVQSALDAPDPKTSELLGVIRDLAGKDTKGSVTETLLEATLNLKGWSRDELRDGIQRLRQRGDIQWGAYGRDSWRPTDGKVDLDVIAPGVSHAQHDRVRMALDAVRSLSAKSERGWALEDDIVEELRRQGIGRQQTLHDLETLVRNSVIFPKGGRGTYAPLNPAGPQVAA